MKKTLGLPTREINPDRCRRAGGFHGVTDAEMAKMTSSQRAFIARWNKPPRKTRKGKK